MYFLYLFFITHKWQKHKQTVNVLKACRGWIKWCACKHWSMCKSSFLLLSFCLEASANICEAWVCFLLRLFMPRPILNDINKRWNVNVSSCFQWSDNFRGASNYYTLLFIYLKSLFSAKDWCTKIEKMMQNKQVTKPSGQLELSTEFVFGSSTKIHAQNTLYKSK